MLSALRVQLDVQPVDIDESPKEGEDSTVYAERLAREKACAAALGNIGVPILGGDTIVTLDGALLGKPKDAQDAREMLRILSGREHAVVSGWALVRPNGEVESGTETAWVRFDDLSDEQIAQYVNTGEPMDKAGAYGIQGQGGELVAGYRGDFTTIVGFPMEPVLRSLGRCGLVPDTPLFRRYASVMGRVAVAAAESGRSVDDIRVVAASKAQPDDLTMTLYTYGHRDFGESYVQELVSKSAHLPHDIRWSFIGHLQRNNCVRWCQWSTTSRRSRL